MRHVWDIRLFSLLIYWSSYFKIEKNQKERQNVYCGIRTLDPWFSRPVHSQLRYERFKIGKSIFPMYGKPIFMINLNTDKTVSRQSELLTCLPTSLTHKKFRLMSRLNFQNELTRLPDTICPLTCYQSKESKIEKVPRGSLGDKSSLRNLVSTIGTQATTKKGKRKFIPISRYSVSVIGFWFFSMLRFL